MHVDGAHSVYRLVGTVILSGTRQWSWKFLSPSFLYSRPLYGGTVQRCDAIYPNVIHISSLVQITEMLHSIVCELIFRVFSNPTQENSGKDKKLPPNKDEQVRLC